MDKWIPVMSALAGTLCAFPLSASAQAVDSINSINGEMFQSDLQARYFGQRDCGLAGGSDGPDDTTFEIRLEDSGTALTSVYLWVGTGGAECETLEQRNASQGTCAEMAGNPHIIGANFLVAGLTLRDLLNADSGLGGIVDCESSGLSGTPYKIFAFRNEPPSGDVEASGYGVAEFFIDVEAPAPPLVDTSPQAASTFTITWSSPNPPDAIQAWLAYASDSDDPSTALSLDVFVEQAARAVSLSASQLGLVGEGDTAYVFMQSYDQAFVSDPLGGNRSELSESVEVTFIDDRGVDAGVDAGVDGGEPAEASGGSGRCSTSRTVATEQAVWLAALLLFALRQRHRKFV